MFRGQIVVFITFLNRSCWAGKECHLTLLKQTKIDQAKNQQSFTSFVYKNAAKILKTRKENFSGRQLSQVASTMKIRSQKLCLWAGYHTSDQGYYKKAKWGTKNRCLWTGPKPSYLRWNKYGIFAICFPWLWFHKPAGRKRTQPWQPPVEAAP